MKKITPTLAQKVKEDFIEYDNKIYNQAIDDALAVIKKLWMQNDKFSSEVCITIALDISKLKKSSRKI